MGNGWGEVDAQGAGLREHAAKRSPGHFAGGAWGMDPVDKERYRAMQRARSKGLILRLTNTFVD
jgi:hypothetical protein